jgi:hypothetical protein
MRLLTEKQAHRAAPRPGRPVTILTAYRRLPAKSYFTAAAGSR